MAHGGVGRSRDMRRACNSEVLATNMRLLMMGRLVKITVGGGVARESAGGSSCRKSPNPSLLPHITLKKRDKGTEQRLQDMQDITTCPLEQFVCDVIAAS